MKKFMILMATAATPFWLVWAGYVLTAGSFNPQDIFQAGSFWGLSCMYWVLWTCLSPMIMEIINEVHKPAK